MFETASNFWNGTGNWRGYKATTAAVTASVVKTLTENSWVFTSIPLAGETDSNIPAKIAYMLTLVATNAIIAGSMGLAVDYLRSIYNDEPTEASRLNVPT